MTKSNLSRLRTDKRCDSCLKVISAGEIAYVRIHRRYPAVYCIPCYEKRRESWLKAREGKQERELERLLAEGPILESDAEERTGLPVRRLVRNLTKNGYPIGMIGVKVGKPIKRKILLYNTNEKDKVRNFLLTLYGQSAKFKFPLLFESDSVEVPVE